MGILREIMGFVFPLLYILSVTAGLCLVWKKPAGNVIPSAILFSGIELFLATFFSGSFTVGCLSALLLPVAGLLILTRVGFAKAKQYLYTPGMAAFLLMYVYVFWLQHGRTFVWWDEVIFWGDMVSETLRLDTLYSVPQAVLSIHKDYPPLFPLMEAAWCRMSGGFSHQAMYCCLLTVGLSLFLPMFEEIEWNKAALPKVVIAWAVILLGTSVVAGDVAFLSSVYLDYPMALLGAYMLALVVLFPEPGPFEAFNLAVAGTALLMTKQMGIAFYMLAMGLLAAIWLLQLALPEAGTRRLQSAGGYALTFVLAGAVPLGINRLWSRYVVVNEIEAQFETKDIHVLKLPAIFLGTEGKDFQQEAAQNFVNAFVHRNLWAAASGKILLSYLQLIFVFALVLAVGTFLLRSVFSLRHLILADLVLCGGSLCYAFVMWLLYVFNFGSYEGPTLASYLRYMNTYWFYVGVVIIMLLLVWAQTLKNWQNIAVTLLACALIFCELRWEQPRSLRRIVGGRQDVEISGIETPYEDSWY